MVGSCEYGSESSVSIRYVEFLDDMNGLNTGVGVPIPLGQPLVHVILYYVEDAGPGYPCT